VPCPYPKSHAGTQGPSPVRSGTFGRATGRMARSILSARPSIGTQVGSGGRHGAGAPHPGAVLPGHAAMGAGPPGRGGRSSAAGGRGRGSRRHPVNGSIQELLERSPFLEGLDRRDLVELPQLGVGEGFPVRRAFAGVDLRALDPFVHMDQVGDVNYAPGEPKGTPWHPHRGFETVTYMLDGILRHQDSNGGGGLITDGDTQWMTAGRGLIHIEAPPEEVVVCGGAVPRLPAVGQPARPAEVVAAALPGHPRWRGDPAE